MVKQYNDNQLLDRAKKMSGFLGIPPEYWILGVRSIADNPNKFDDKFYLFLGEKFILMATGTTNPGTPILTHYENVNKEGAAVLKADQWYNRVWHYGKHNGKVEALLQLGNEVQVYRDTDKDLKSEQIGKLQTGYFGINFHPNTYTLDKKNGTQIGGWSAGCQVVNDIANYKKIIALCKPQKVVTYCLISEF